MKKLFGIFMILGSVFLMTSCDDSSSLTCTNSEDGSSIAIEFDDNGNVTSYIVSEEGADDYVAGAFEIGIINMAAEMEGYSNAKAMFTAGGYEEGISCS